MKKRLSLLAAILLLSGCDDPEPVAEVEKAPEWDCAAVGEHAYNIYNFVAFGFSPSSLRAEYPKSTPIINEAVYLRYDMTDKEFAQRWVNKCEEERDAYVEKN